MSTQDHAKNERLRQTIAELEDANFARDFVDVYGGYPVADAVQMLIRRQSEMRKENDMAQKYVPGSNVALASVYFSRLLQCKALDMSDAEREDFFDPRNKTQWLQWMVDRILEENMRLGASNE